LRSFRDLTKGKKTYGRRQTTDAATKTEGTHTVSDEPNSLTLLFYVQQTLRPTHVHLMHLMERELDLH